MKSQVPASAIADRLLYIVLADLVDSTHFTTKMCNDVGLARLREFEDAAKDALSEMNPPSAGKIVKTNGDAVLLVFDHFPDIVRWNIMFRGSLRTKLTSDGKFRSRMRGMKARVWVHVGEVSLAEHDVQGLAVSVLHKIEQNSKQRQDRPEGEIIVTQCVRQLARPVLYPLHYGFRLFSTVKLEGPPLIKLYRLVAKPGELDFVISKQLKAKSEVPQT